MMEIFQLEDIATKHHGEKEKWRLSIGPSTFRLEQPKGSQGKRGRRLPGSCLTPMTTKLTERDFWNHIL